MDVPVDSIELFFVDSHQNGATSWIPKTLPENIKVIISLTFDEGAPATSRRSEASKSGGYALHKMRIHYQF